MKIVTWNIDRRAPDTWQAEAAVGRIASRAPDIVCLTEAHEGSLNGLHVDGRPGHVLVDRGVLWAREAETERKVLLWSRNPWTDVLKDGELSAIGGAVGGVTETDLGPVRVVGVCIPHHLAWPTGMTPRPKPWSHHVEFLERLEAFLGSLPADHPLVVIGDFNQQAPAAFGLMAARKRFDRTFSGLSMITRGDPSPADDPLIDHVAVGKMLRAKSVHAFSRFTADGKPLSSHPHHEVVVELEAGGVQIFD
jgi:endonuclease/exonuclease/phosphatase family metal-dependent hydrolase